MFEGLLDGWAGGRMDWLIDPISTSYVWPIYIHTHELKAIQ